jgi:hypothetical protein
VHPGRHQQTIKLILDYQLSVIVKPGASVPLCDSLDKVRVFVGDGLNLEKIDPFGRFENKPPALIKTEYRCF